MSMEIAHGPFCREVVIPEQVDHNRMMTRYAEGYLWVTLPLRSHG
jgi:HSP20 family molecular chaperone IbpA